MKCLVAVIGPTAVGKTKLALRLAQDFNGEIINADSRQVYRFMDIGTAKPDPVDQLKVPHHLIDIVNPDESFSLAVYQKSASHIIKDIQQRHKLPLLVGGSGLYAWSVIEGWKIPEVPPDAEFRQRMEAKSREEGSSNSLFEELRRIDPEAATRIMPSNLRRIIRALEIYHKTGYPASKLWRKETPPFPVLIIGLTADRETLYQMIDFRVEEMIKQGLIDEVRELMAKGYNLYLPSMSGIGYRQAGMFLQEKLSLAEAIQQTKYETHKFARRQYNWFNLSDSRIHWFDICDNIQAAINDLLAAFLYNLNSKKD